MDCRLERSRQWAVRAVHEAKTHDENCFVTLTYDDEHLPHRGSLRLRDWQLFRKRVQRRKGPFRFMQCGEYGERTGRPHFHALLFGLDFRVGGKLHKRSRTGEALYRSPELDRLWGNGHCLVGELTFESAAYVARYCTKKITGWPAELHYVRRDAETGEAYFLQPEFATMSTGRRKEGQGGIGFRHIREFLEETYLADAVISRGKRAKPPRYYDKVLKELAPDVSDQVKAKRQLEPKPPRSRKQLHDREKHLTQQLSLKSRDPG